tara:strand:- start:897 stop:1094 length:198 start_codon:yes stop_codon:yes gene_type:complete
MLDMKSAKEDWDDNLNKITKLRKTYERILQQAKDDTTTYELYQTLHHSIKDLEDHANAMIEKNKD